MKKIIILILFFLIVYSDNLSQEIIWNKKYEPNQSDLFYSPSVSVNNNELILVNFIRRRDGADVYGGNKFQFSRINPTNGAITFLKEFTLNHVVVSLRGIKNVNENEFMIYGEIEDNKLYYAIINNQGELITEKYMLTDIIQMGGVFSYIINSDNNFIATHTDKKHLQGLICKYDLEFNIIDSIRIFYAVEDTSIKNGLVPFNINCQTSNGEYIFSYRHLYPYNKNYYFKTDKYLNILWSRDIESILFPGYPADKFLIRFLEENSDGSFFVAMNNSWSASDSTFALLHLDSDGNVIQKNFYGGKTYYDLDKDEPQMRTISVVDLHRDRFGNYLLGCSYRYPIILETDPSGNLIWQKMYNNLDTNLHVGVVSTFPVFDTTIAMTVSDYEKFQDDFGNIYWKPVNSYIYFVENKTSNIVEEKKLGFDIIFYPNPNSGEFSIGLNNLELNKIFSIEVYDIIGNKVFGKQNISGMINIDIKDKPIGFYIIRININNQIINKQFIKVN